MADPGTGNPRSLITQTGHMTIMAALVAFVCLGTLGRCDNPVVPSSPGSSFDFNDVDADGSGCVEGPEELQNFRLQVGKILGEALHLSSIERALRAGRITHSADVNGDGRICQCDLLSILLTESTRPGVHRHAFRVYEDGSFFDDVDNDHDGVLDDVTESEALAQKLAQCVPLQQARALVDAMSKLAKDDGKLTRDEYLLFLQTSPHHWDLASAPSSSSLPQPASLPQPMPHQPQPQPQTLPQMKPLPQPEPQRHFPVVNGKLENPPPKHPQIATQQGNGADSEPSPDKSQGRPRKRLMPPFSNLSLGKPPQPAQAVNIPPGQPWGQPPHFQPMNKAGQPPRAGNSAGQPLGNQPVQGLVKNQPGQSLRSASPRQRQSSSGRQNRIRSSVPEGDYPQADPRVPLDKQVLQRQLNPGRLENVPPELQRGGGPQPDLEKLELIRAGNQAQHHQGQSQDQPEVQPGHPEAGLGQPEATPNQLEAQPGQSQPRSGQPGTQSSQPKAHPYPPAKPPSSVHVNQEMKNLSKQLNKIHPKSQPSLPQPNLSQPQSVDKSLETQLQQKKRN